MTTTITPGMLRAELAARNIEKRALAKELGIRPDVLSRLLNSDDHQELLDLAWERLRGMAAPK